MLKLKNLISKENSSVRDVEKVIDDFLKMDFGDFNNEIKEKLDEFKKEIKNNQNLEEAQIVRKKIKKFIEEIHQKKNKLIEKKYFIEKEITAEKEKKQANDFNSHFGAFYSLFAFIWIIYCIFIFFTDFLKEDIGDKIGYFITFVITFFVIIAPAYLFAFILYVGIKIYFFFSSKEKQNKLKLNEIFEKINNLEEKIEKMEEKI